MAAHVVADRIEIRRAAVAPPHPAGGGHVGQDHLAQLAAEHRLVGDVDILLVAGA